MVSFRLFVLLRSKYERKASLCVSLGIADFFCNLTFLLQKITFDILNDLKSFLKLLLGVINHSVKVTRLDAIVYYADAIVYYAEISDVLHSRLWG